MPAKSKEKWERGDFQTPYQLAESAISVLASNGFKPSTIIEPTCGRGSFLLAAGREFLDSQRLIGLEINEDHLSVARQDVSLLFGENKTNLIQADFFNFNWEALITNLPQPILIVGNPPWVTNSELGYLRSANLPVKSNINNLTGYDALTGKSNFDISEWMIIKYFKWLENREGVIAILCKTAVARKVLKFAWQKGLRISNCKMFGINAQEHFNASVDACFLVIEMTNKVVTKECEYYSDLNSPLPAFFIGFRENFVVANVKQFDQWSSLISDGKVTSWRSGIKHDCSKIMELEKVGDRYQNGMDSSVELEEDYIFPMLKSSDISNGKIRIGRKYMLVPQRKIDEDTDPIRRIAPKTWEYLRNNEGWFDKRASSIYKGRYRFSIFGVGEYSFAPWKVAVSGFYKRLVFRLISEYEGKPVVVDDTIYFMPFWSETEARLVCDLLNSEPSRQFFESMIFWSDKRPITIELLKRLDLRALSIAISRYDEYDLLIERKGYENRVHLSRQATLQMDN